MQFLKAVKVNSYHVLETLRDRSLPDCKAVLKAIGNGIGPLTWFALELLGKDTPAVTIEEKVAFLKSEGYRLNLDERQLKRILQRLVPLRDSIWEWSRSTGLDADWCRASAFNTLMLWASSEKLNELDWQYIHHKLAVSGFEPEKFCFPHPAWNPGDTSRDAFKSTIQQSFNQQLDKYLDRTQARFGLNTKVKMKHNDRHFTWLVLLQVERKEYREIFESDRQEFNLGEERSVRKAINDLARFIDLPLRSDATRPGRRSKA